MGYLDKNQIRSTRNRIGIPTNSSTQPERSTRVPCEDGSIVAALHVIALG